MTPGAIDGVLICKSSFFHLDLYRSPVTVCVSVRGQTYPLLEVFPVGRTAGGVLVLDLSEPEAQLVPELMNGLHGGRPEGLTLRLEHRL